MFCFCTTPLARFRCTELGVQMLSRATTCMLKDRQALIAEAGLLLLVAVTLQCWNYRPVLVIVEGSLWFQYLIHMKSVWEPYEL